MKDTHHRVKHIMYLSSSVKPRTGIAFDLNYFQSETFLNSNDVASDVGVNLCNVKSCLNTSNNEIFTDKRCNLPCVYISKHTCPVVK